MHTKKLNQSIVDRISELLESSSIDRVLAEIEEFHPEDVAELLERLDLEQAKALLYALPEERAAEVIVELDEEVRASLLQEYSGKELAQEVIENLDSDDAADIISELPQEKIHEVLQSLEDPDQAREIADLLNYAEDTAGSIMAKELVKVNASWKLMRCLREMRRQAEKVDQVHAIYVVDDDDRLLGTLSLKKLLTTSTKTPVSEVYDRKIIKVTTDTHVEEVARLMRKYDLVVIPVVDHEGRLMGRITFDDVMDVMKEEAERDYQMASGLAQDVESADSIFALSKARLPWLLIGMLGGVISSRVVDFFDISQYPEMAAFMPLIAATGGNVGVQSAALVVQSLANDSFNESILQKLLKDLGVGLVTALVCASLMFAVTAALGKPFNLSITVSIALVSVIVFAAMFGTLVPLTLNKLKIDPAVATGPFVTTTNDVIGLFIYFSVAKLIM
ncbi:magnesium transporter [Thermaurantimonas aggregans]|uniref:magnesium transporter n=1 Tax=Thermaurantimonas aggregans TaxID=2173829 RepID=UPI0023F1C2D5|nr:magnesium transporter [Thermaurantimonas aggregans]MCX8148425.1 magnesium transporter [Thermaurantimonas aggregans]